MKFLISVIFALMLSGCYQSVNIRDIQDAVIICGKLENVVEIRAHSVGHEVVECSNRISYHIDSSNLKGK